MVDGYPYAVYGGIGGIWAGVGEAEAIDMGTGLGWVHDAPAGMFDVVRPEPTERQGREAVDVVQRLTELAVVLDEAKK